MTAASDNVSALCRQLDEAVRLYGEQLTKKAETDAEYRSARAKRVLKARNDGEKAISGAELVADADDVIARLRLEYLIAEGMAAATKSRLAMLTERIGFGRSLMASDRESDKQYSRDGANT